jgi:hypothetical protein
MLYFHTKNADLGIFWRALGWKIVFYIMVTWFFIAILANFMANWYFCGQFGTFFPILVNCAKRNLATLLGTTRRLGLMGPIKGI